MGRIILCLLCLVARIVWCFWKGHTPPMFADRIWIGNNRFEVKRCRVCEKMLHMVPLTWNGRKCMRLKVEILEEPQ